MGTDDHVNIFVERVRDARSLPGDALTVIKELVRGLSSESKWLSPRWFYDERGSLLFEAITRLPEYYLTRAESEILSDKTAEIARQTKADTLVELGAGSIAKVQMLLHALGEYRPRRRYVAVDVSVEALLRSVQQIRSECSDVDVEMVRADFQEPLRTLPLDGVRMVAFLGSTIGNLFPAERAMFLRNVHSYLRPGEALLLGIDLAKEPSVLVQAYNDTQGITAEFNLNALRVLNRHFDGNFDLDAFSHAANWNPADQWIEMHLQSRIQQSVRLATLDIEVDFVVGEEMRTEISTKFQRRGLEGELVSAGFDPMEWWTDHAGRYAVSLSTSS
jgi:L-histidine N-alpha-methyltransferase